jgi:hypothetical protein
MKMIRGNVRKEENKIINRVKVNKKKEQNEEETKRKQER